MYLRWDWLWIVQPQMTFLYGSRVLWQILNCHTHTRILRHWCKCDNEWTKLIKGTHQWQISHPLIGFITWWMKLIPQLNGLGCFCSAALCVWMPNFTALTFLVHVSQRLGFSWLLGFNHFVKIVDIRTDLIEFINGTLALLLVSTVRLINFLALLSSINVLNGVPGITWKFVFGN